MLAASGSLLAGRVQCGELADTVRKHMPLKSCVTRSEPVREGSTDMDGARL